MNKKILFQIQKSNIFSCVFIYVTKSSLTCIHFAQHCTFPPQHQFSDLQLVRTSVNTQSSTTVELLLNCCYSWKHIQPALLSANTVPQNGKSGWMSRARWGLMGHNTQVRSHSHHQREPSAIIPTATDGQVRASWGYLAPPGGSQQAWTNTRSVTDVFLHSHAFFPRSVYTDDH